MWMQNVFMDSKEDWVSTWEKDLLQVTKQASHISVTKSYELKISGGWKSIRRITYVPPVSAPTLP